MQVSPAPIFDQNHKDFADRFHRQYHKRYEDMTNIEKTRHDVAQKSHAVYSHFVPLNGILRDAISHGFCNEGGFDAHWEVITSWVAGGAIAWWYGQYRDPTDLFGKMLSSAVVVLDAFRLQNYGENVSVFGQEEDNAKDEDIGRDLGAAVAAVSGSKGEKMGKVTEDLVGCLEYVVDLAQTMVVKPFKEAFQTSIDIEAASAVTVPGTNADVISYNPSETQSNVETSSRRGRIAQTDSSALATLLSVTSLRRPRLLEIAELLTVAHTHVDAGNERPASEAISHFDVSALDHVRQSLNLWQDLMFPTSLSEVEPEGLPESHRTASKPPTLFGPPPSQITLSTRSIPKAISARRSDFSSFS